MKSNIYSILDQLLYENGELSLTRCLSCLGYIVFIIGSAYLLLNHLDWRSYDVFAAYTGGAGLGLQFGNKFINSKYNSPIGSFVGSMSNTFMPNSMNNNTPSSSFVSCNHMTTSCRSGSMAAEKNANIGKK